MTINRIQENFLIPGDIRKTTTTTAEEKLTSYLAPMLCPPTKRSNSTGCRHKARTGDSVATVHHHDNLYRKHIAAVVGGTVGTVAIAGRLYHQHPATTQMLSKADPTPLYVGTNTAAGVCGNGVSRSTIHPTAYPFEQQQQQQQQVYIRWGNKDREEPPLAVRSCKLLGQRPQQHPAWESKKGSSPLSSEERRTATLTQQHPTVWLYHDYHHHTARAAVRSRNGSCCWRESEGERLMMMKKRQSAQLLAEREKETERDRAGEERERERER
ncbi:hypothetical protein C0Q70_14927 [Pomacea canaliculata]|uniref:Uncharacterized protein n=1 Tax=Pomacea canaliculata TaxID=400727 RepID=A0A2T7NTF8_POMCA|nr:hypothetical protein C0Q70_14927 [Pomacea canaliculata]